MGLYVLLVAPSILPVLTEYHWYLRFVPPLTCTEMYAVSPSLQLISALVVTVGVFAVTSIEQLTIYCSSPITGRVNSSYPGELIRPARYTFVAALSSSSSIRQPSGSTAEPISAALSMSVMCTRKSCPAVTLPR